MPPSPTSPALTTSEPSQDVESAQTAIKERIEKTASPRLYALLIGVNKYVKKDSNLSGAIPDARAIKGLLLQMMPPVDESRIQILEDSDACAQNIIDQIRNIGKREDIDEKDPILIYYAGHGSNIPAPPGWPSGSSRIQCLSPHDADIKKVDGKIEVEGVITDHTFGAILQELADAKSNNITVILDSCHSGSATRADTLGGVPRGIKFEDEDGKVEYTVNASYQKDIWCDYEARLVDGGTNRALVSLSGFVNGGLRSHIVLSACGPNEYAFEDRSKGANGVSLHQGRFTAAIIRELEGKRPDEMTYVELVRRLGNLQSQTPQCEGQGKDTRVLFGPELAQGRRSHYEVYRLDSACIMRAGQVNGIRPDDTFNVYPNLGALRSKPNEPLGSLVVISVRPVSSVMSPDFDVNTLDTHPSAVAVLSIAGTREPISLQVHPDLGKITAEALAAEVVDFAEVPESNFVIASPETPPPVLSLVPVGDKDIGFEILDPDITKHGLMLLDGTVPRDASKLRNVLRAAAHFFFHLRSSPSQPGLKRQIRAIVQPVSYGVDFSKRVPMPSWKTEGDALNIQTMTDDAFYPKVSLPRALGPSPTSYGVHVANEYPGEGFDLYLWMFYFDCRTLEIGMPYGPAAGTNIEPPLRVASHLTLPLNYGEAGNHAFTFEMPQERKIDVGFLRIFLSTQQADLSNIVQGAVIGKKAPSHRTWTSQPEVWDAITLAVVQRHQ